MTENMWKPCMCTVGEEMDIEVILTVMDTTELVVEIRPEKIQAPTGPITSAIPVQHSTYWANKPTGSWIQINLPSGE